MSDRWQQLRCKRELLRERDALAERADRLHKALRKQCVDRTGDYGRCVLCESLWRFKDAETHAIGCLAAPSAPKDAP